MAKYFWIATKAIIQNQEWKVLILYKSKEEDINPNSFDIPWGRLERGEELEKWITREVKEETNLNIEVNKVTRTRWFTKNDLHLVGITYLANMQNNQDNIILSWEHDNYFWKTKEEILDWDFPNWLKEEIKII